MFGFDLVNIMVLLRAKIAREMSSWNTRGWKVYHRSGRSSWIVCDAVKRLVICVRHTNDLHSMIVRGQKVRWVVSKTNVIGTYLLIRLSVHSWHGKSGRQGVKSPREPLQAVATTQPYILVRNQAHPAPWDVASDHPSLLIIILSNAGRTSHRCRGLHSGDGGQETIWKVLSCGNIMELFTLYLKAVAQLQN